MTISTTLPPLVPPARGEAELFSPQRVTGGRLEGGEILVVDSTPSQPPPARGRSQNLPPSGGEAESFSPQRGELEGGESPELHTHPAILARARELRCPLTPAEQKLWQRLRKKQLYGIKFRRQHPIYRFILDFFTFEHRLAIEVDGHSHAVADQQQYDAARTEWLNLRGIRVIRFTNDDVLHNLEAVLEKIAEACGVDVPAATLPPPNLPLLRGGVKTSPPAGGTEGGRNPHKPTTPPLKGGESR